MLPIAGVFAAFDVGLLQARLVMAAYLIAFVAAVYLLGKRLGGRVIGLVAGALLLSTL
jgi:4-amino-4-deoxy-L-arabinose transferase-like glycosyltransferase